MKTFEVQFWLKGTHMTEYVQGVTRTAAWNEVYKRYRKDLKFISATEAGEV